MSDNEFDAVRALRADAPPPSAGTLGAARARLTDVIDAPVPIAMPRTRRWLPALAAAAVIAAVAGGAVALTSRHGSAPSPGPSPQQAATQPQQSPSDEPVAAGFQLVTDHTWSISEAALAERNVWYFSEGTTRTWIPADRTQTWYFHTEYNTAGRYLSSADAEYVRTHNPELTESGSEQSSGRNGLPADSIGGPAGWNIMTPQWAAALPTDPSVLRASLYDAATKLSDEANHYGKTDDPDSQAYDYLSSLFAYCYLPPDVAAAAYQVATTIPGVTTVDSVQNLDGVAGVGLRRTNNLDDQSTTLIFDTAAGTYLGARTVVTATGWNAHHDSTGEEPMPITHVPVGTVISDSAVSVRDVDSAPSVTGTSTSIPRSGAVHVVTSP